MKMKDITPEAYACGNCSCQCPTVFETANDTYVIIGKKLSAEALAVVEGRVGADEYVVEVPKGMIDGIQK